MTLSIDTDAATARAARWSEVGHRAGTLHTRAASLAASLEFPPGIVADLSLSRAAASLWTAATIVAQAVDAALAGEVFHLPNLTPETSWSSPIGGDLEGTFDAELRRPYLTTATGLAAIGWETIIRALEDSSSPAQIRRDEFQIVRFEDATLVVLPGVTDLTNFSRGLSEENRTVRDLDQTALKSFLSDSFDDNDYAVMVAEAIDRAGVPRGSNVVIVGHSDGANTALDLAANDAFNGEGGFNVTHVVAAAYAAAGRVGDLPDHTRALVIENIRDVPVFFERLGQHTVKPVYDVVNNPAQLVNAIPLVGGFRLAKRQLDAVDDYEDGRAAFVFWGGFDGSGHDQSNYIDFLQSDATSQPFLHEFAATLGAVLAPAPMGPTAMTKRRQPQTGTASAIDVSVPQGS